MAWSLNFLITSGTDGGTTSHYVFNKARFDSSDCDLDEANGYNFPSEIWNGTKGIDDYGYVFSEDYPFIMPGYYGTELHPVIGLTGSSLATSGLLVGMCMATVWGWGLFQYWDWKARIYCYDFPFCISWFIQDIQTLQTVHCLGLSCLLLLSMVQLVHNTYRYKLKHSFTMFR